MSQEQEGRYLEYSLKYKIALGISCFFFLIVLIILLFSIYIGIKRIGPNLKNPVVSQGLNKRRRICAGIYYVHFFLIRAFLSLMVILSPFVKAKYIWITILGMQIILTFLHLIKFYETWSLYVQAILREIYILSIVSLLLATQFTDQTDKE